MFVAVYIMLLRTGLVARMGETRTAYILVRKNYTMWSWMMGEQCSMHIWNEIYIYIYIYIYIFSFENVCRIHLCTNLKDELHAGKGMENKK
jgi:hypothetical protein